MNCLELGLMPYGAALKLQEDYVAKRIRGEIGDTLLALEHPPVVVMGRAGNRRNLLLSPEELAARGIELAESSRGGDVTFHCPGQLVAYPIVDLGENMRDLHEYLRKLEEIVIRLLADCGVAGVRSEGMTGVWANGAKIASIGVAVRRWVAFHGLALNVNNDLAGFSCINPCGFKDLAVTSLSQILGREIAIADLLPGLFHHSRRVLSARMLSGRWLNYDAASEIRF